MAAKRRAGVAGAAIATIAVCGLAAGCSPGEPAHVPAGLKSPFTGYTSARYRDPKAWLCTPDLPTDPCRTDLTTTEILADGSRRVLHDVPAKDPPVDCFYVYPTVDGGFFARNHADFSDLGPMTNTTVAQVAQFSKVCRMFAPLYRQVTLGTYLSWESRREAFLTTAFSDVDDAFLQYMSRYNHGRRVVLIGHSQGAEMIVRLLRKRFDADPAMRERLVVAYAIGATVEVAHGKTTGASLTNIPVCTRPEETGCVVAFRTHRSGEIASGGPAAPPPGHDTVCASPAGEGSRYLHAYFPVTDGLRSYLKGLDDVHTPFVEFTDFYAARCVDGPDGYRYLEVRIAPRPGDGRTAPFTFDHWFLGTSIGMHILDFQFPQGDLIDLVRTKMASEPAAR